jgi:hypothetical protein
MQRREKRDIKEKEKESAAEFWNLKRKTRHVHHISKPII